MIQNGMSKGAVILYKTFYIFLYSSPLPFSPIAILTGFLLTRTKKSTQKVNSLHERLVCTLCGFKRKVIYILLKKEAPFQNTSQKIRERGSSTERENRQLRVKDLWLQMPRSLPSRTELSRSQQFTEWAMANALPVGQDGLGFTWSKISSLPHSVLLRTSS